MILWVLERPRSLSQGSAPSGFHSRVPETMRKNRLPFLCGSLALSNMLLWLPDTQLRLLSPGCPCDGAAPAGCPSRQYSETRSERVEQSACWQRPEPHTRGMVHSCGFRDSCGAVGGSGGGTWGKSPSGCQAGQTWGHGV